MADDAPAPKNATVTVVRIYDGDGNVTQETTTTVVHSNPKADAQPPVGGYL